MPKKRIILSWLPALVFMGVLFYCSSIPGDKIHLPDFRFSDKVAHFFAYSCLGWLLTLRKVLRGSLGSKLESGKPIVAEQRRSKDMLGQVVGILYGVSDEFHQIFVPLRDASVFDWSADALGVCAGSWLCRKMFAAARRINAG